MPDACCSSDFLVLDRDRRSVGDFERVLISFGIIPRLAASSPSNPRFTPGNGSSPSPRGIGVAFVSTETTERTGKTRSTVLGEKEESAWFEGGGERARLLVAPEKMLTAVCRGDIPILVCMDEAMRVTEYGTALPCSERVDVRELVEARRDEELPGG